MKKTKTILTLALCGTLAFGGSTLVSNQNTQATEGLLSSLNRLENSINRTYDFSNLEQTFLNDDYFLFYNSGAYGISNTRSNYLYDGYSNFNQSTQNQHM